MARLADLVWNRPWSFCDKADVAAQEQYNQDCLYMIANLPVIVGDNVCEYIYSLGVEKEWATDADFPCCSPPFENFFFETKAPAATQQKESKVWMPQMWGFICLSYKVEESQQSENCAAVFVSIPIMLEKDRILSPAGYLVADIGRDHCIKSAGRATLFDDSPNSWVKIWNVLQTPLQLTMSFMNCKNVKVIDNKPRDLKSREIKAKQRPWVTYKTLDIEPMRRVLRTEGNAESTGLKRALHICRGHFATYTPEKPLFGRVSGQFWIPAHVRGNKQNGVVVKDYNANPPTE